MALTSVVFHAAESASTGGVNPWFVGGSLMVIFLALIIGLLSFGKGREHS